MATLTAGHTIIEMAKMISPIGKQMKIAEVLAKEISMLFDIIFVPSNDIWGHKSLEEASEDTAVWRALNEHVASGEELTNENYDVIGILERFAEFDIEWVDNQPNPAMARIMKAKSKLKAMARALCSAFLYSNNRTTPKQPHGMMPRLNTTGRYVISHGDSATLTSILVVTHGEDAVHGIYPMNSEAPDEEFIIRHKDMGEQLITDSSGNHLRKYVDNFKFKGGLVVEDYRTLGRVANINSATAKVQAWENDLITVMERMEVTEKTVIYMNETMTAAARIRQKDKNNVHWTPGKGEGLFGRPVMMFDETPVKKIDSRILLNSESQIS